MSSPSLTNKHWIIESLDPIDLSSGAISSLAQKRGIDLTSDAQKKLCSPFAFPEMKQVLEIIRSAMNEKKTICIVGDYDADGITASLQLFRFFKRHGVEPLVYLPDRMKEGYGLKKSIIDWCKQEGVDLIITVDTGITAHDEILYALLQNIDVIVTDHHHARRGRPPASAVIHPTVPSSCGYEHFCGAGVAFMLIRALEDEKPWEGVDEDLALAAIGTIGDIVPLTGENRTLVRYGLKKMEALKMSPLSELLDLVCSHRPITSSDIAFRIVPRLNAAGRMAHPRLAFDALRDGGEALSILHTLNEERQETVKELWNEVDHLLSSPLPLLAHFASSATAGTVGLLAGKLTEKTGKPSMVSAPQGDICIASLRSPSSVHIADCLSDPRLAPLLISFGGHAQAAGCSFHASNKEDVHRILTEIIASSVDTETLCPSITAHASLSKNILPSISFIDSVSVLHPFGAQNEEPVFYCPRFSLTDLRTVGADASHLQCRLQGIKTIGFGLGHLLPLLQKQSTIDALVTLSINEWNNQKEPQYLLKDLRIAL